MSRWGDRVRYLNPDEQLPGERLQTPIDAQQLSFREARYIVCGHANWHGDGDTDDGDRAQDFGAERARQGEFKGDHDGTEQKKMPSVPRIHVIPDGVVPKCRGYAESIESVARDPPRINGIDTRISTGPSAAIRASLQR